MKKLLFVFIALLSFTSCNQDEAKRAEIEKLNSQITHLSSMRNNLSQEVLRLEKKKASMAYVAENRAPKYIVKLKIYQSRLSLDIGQHIKDGMNSIELEIPVDKDYYNQLSIGTKIVDRFRVGSLLMSSSIGNWNIKVIDKRIG